MELPVTCHQKRCESFHIFEFKNIQVTKATFNNRKFMKNLVFVVQIRIHVCLPRDKWSLRGEEIILQLFTEVEVVVPRPRSGEVNIHHKPPTLWWIIFLVYTKTVRYISTKLMIFNSFTGANDYNFGAQWPSGRGRRFFLPTNKTFEGICLAVVGKFLQKELWILFVFKIIL